VQDKKTAEGRKEGVIARGPETEENLQSYIENTKTRKGQRTQKKNTRGELKRKHRGTLEQGAREEYKFTREGGVAGGRTEMESWE